ncbi:hypothetical protein C8P63_11733 [Melghirimyces profundicolus]|uniref:Uncharacterized protein n=1 Tax=Melghirimyces profundicolus TaxID=1242148 RepID=A0A2T6BQH1_9BACL|nr:hypothetical protein [Melghirimyces profundicolus]PTX58286.1 hypothetical protein C8P63_11733 [Melghirimyces profundicolus]
MSQLSARKLSSLLTSRSPSSEKEPDHRPDSSIHKDWDERSRASLVILWGLLVYPALDPELRTQREPSVREDEVYDLFRDYLGTASDWNNVLKQLKAHDYIRYRRDGQRIVAGTKLWTAVDAAKMYRLFRSSVIVRNMWLDQRQKGKNNG